MNCKIRRWELSDARDLATALSNKKYRIIYEMDYHTPILSRMERNLFLQCLPLMKTIRLPLQLR